MTGPDLDDLYRALGGRYELNTTVSTLFICLAILFGAWWVSSAVGDAVPIRLACPEATAPEASR